MSHNFSTKNSPTGPSAFRYRVGLNSEAAYLVSGRPWCKSEIDCESAPVKISFPSVTRWVQIFNYDDVNTHILYVAFSENGLPSNGGTNYFSLEDAITSPHSEMGHNTANLELKVTELWIEGSDSVEIVAGLTSIDSTAIKNNWSGSAGVG